MKGCQRWVEHPPKSLRYEHTMLYHEDVQVSDALRERGLELLDDFEVVVLREGRHEHQAIEHERGVDYALAAQTLPTLRVVPYEYHTVWIRRETYANGLGSLWREGHGDDWGLALLRAVYLTVPTLYPLPGGDFEEVSEEYHGLRCFATRDRDDWTAGVFDGEKLLWRGHDNGHKTANSAIQAAKEWVWPRIAQRLMTKEEYDFLVSCAWDAPDGHFVELGPYQGGSTLFIAQVVEDRGVPFTTIDNFEYDKYGRGSLEVLEANLRDAGVAHLVEAIEGDSREVVDHIDDVAFLFIDTEHTAEQLNAELDAWLPLMVEGGIVALDDYDSDRWPEVTQVVDEWLARWECIGQERHLVAFRRVDA